MNCPNCGFDSPSNMLFCGTCGTSLTVTCSQCGFANPLDYRFCGMCGTRLAEEAIVPAVEQPVFVPATETYPLPIVATPLEGERRNVSVVLTDLTDSTNLLEKVGTEGWVELMNRVLHILESEINRFGGEVSQFRGDGLVAFFGATSAHEDDPERAVLAALSMQRALDLYVREQVQQDASDLRMRVGVNTGEVIVTNASQRETWEETAMGMAVAVAARMETAAEPGTVLVSEHTYRLVDSLFEWEALGEISVRGVRQPIKVYRPLTHIKDPKGFSQGSIFPDFIPNIGREDEFRVVKASVEGLFDGRGGITVITGDKGSGKAFLLGEVRNFFSHRASLLAEAHPEAPPAETSLIWVRGRCRSYTHAWPYSMWLDVFHDWLGIRPEESKEEKRACLRRHAEALLGKDVDEHYPYLATFLGLPLEEAFTEKVRHLNGEGLRQRFFWAVKSWLESSSKNGPVVLAFSDLQWADESSLDLMKYCLPISDNETLLWLLTYRTEREAPIWDFYHFLEAEYPHRLTNLALPPLTETQSQELINHLIGPKTLPQETSNLIIHSAGGNPYYILELIRTLIANGVLMREKDSDPWHITRTVTTLDLPDSLQRLLLARIDRLSPQEGLVLQIAAVIGPVFWLNMVQALLGDNDTLRADLASLQRTQFIQESGRVPDLGMQYVFRSPLIRDAAYEGLLSSQKAGYHLKAAEYLENLINPDVLQNYDEMLAYHYRGAGNQRKELFYTFLAAEKAQEIYASAEALQHYNRAMELLDGLQVDPQLKMQPRSIQTQRFEVLNGRRQVLFRLGQINDSRADTQALIPLARQMEDDPIWLIDALLAQADISTDNRQELEPGLKMAEEALALAQQVGDQQREMRSLIRIANARFTLRDPAWRELAERGLALARQLGDLKAEVNLLLGIGGKYGMDDLPRNREYLQAALARSETLNDKATKLSLLHEIGEQFERDGDYYRQLTEYEMEHLRLSREIGHRIEEGNALMFCGQIQALYLGDYETGLESERQSLRVWENMTSRIFPLLRMTQILTAQGKYTEAIKTLEMARPLGEKVVYDIGRAGLGLVAVILYNSLGDEEHLQSALQITSQIQQMVADNLISRQYHMTAACESSISYLTLAQSLTRKKTRSVERQSYLQKALESSRTALNLYEQFGFVQVIECTSEEILFRHSQALLANDRAAEGVEFLKRAHEEIMRKHDLIPVESPYRKTFLENIPLHQDIQTAYVKQTTSTPHRRSNPSSSPARSK